MKESLLYNEIRLALSKLGIRLFRNNVGVLKDDKGFYVHFGLCKGSSDLIGWDAQARFVAIECKAPGKIGTEEQINFVAQVKAAGGIAGFVTSVEEAIQLIEMSREA